MKQPVTSQILEHLAICGASTVSMIFSAERSLGKSLRKIDRLAEQCSHDFSKQSRHNVSIALSRARARGLVVRKGPKKKTIWHIANKGEQLLKSAEANSFELPAVDNKLRLVMFDIPEDKRNSRDWLRLQLTAADYNFLQRSVWIGNRPLPKETLEEIRARGLLPHVQIIDLDKNAVLRKK